MSVCEKFIDQVARASVLLSFSSNRSCLQKHHTGFDENVDTSITSNITFYRHVFQYIISINVVTWQLTFTLLWKSETWRPASTQEDTRQMSNHTFDCNRQLLRVHLTPRKACIACIICGKGKKFVLVLFMEKLFQNVLNWTKDFRYYSDIPR